MVMCLTTTPVIAQGVMKGCQYPEDQISVGFLMVRDSYPLTIGTRDSYQLIICSIGNFIVTDSALEPY